MVSISYVYAQDLFKTLQLWALKSIGYRHTSNSTYYTRRLIFVKITVAVKIWTPRWAGTHYSKAWLADVSRRVFNRQHHLHRRRACTSAFQMAAGGKAAVCCHFPTHPFRVVLGRRQLLPTGREGGGRVLHLWLVGLHRAPYARHILHPTTALREDKKIKQSF